MQQVKTLKMLRIELLPDFAAYLPHTESKLKDALDDFFLWQRVVTCV